jgi:hypothetical protein
MDAQSYELLTKHMKDPVILTIAESPKLLCARWPEKFGADQDYWEISVCFRY